MFSHAKPVVLILEDSRTCRDHLDARLRGHPHYARVYATDRLSNARTWLQSRDRSQGKLVLAVLDLELPDGDGRELLPALNNVHVIIVTAHPGIPAPRDDVVVIAKGRAWVTQVEAILTRITQQQSPIDRTPRQR